MGNKRLKKRAYSLKGLGRRGLSLLMAMVMTLSLVQISAFATDGEENDTLKPKALADPNNHGITLSKTAERVGDTEWKVTVKADIGNTPIKQQPLDVVFVLDQLRVHELVYRRGGPRRGQPRRMRKMAKSSYDGTWYQPRRFHPLVGPPCRGIYLWL